MTTRNLIKARLMGINQYRIEKLNAPKYQLDFNSAYGGYQLQEVVNERGGIRTVTDRLTAREMLAFCEGYMAAIVF
jgi:hypothetical protein